MYVNKYDIPFVFIPHSSTFSYEHLWYSTQTQTLTDIYILCGGFPEVGVPPVIHSQDALRSLLTQLTAPGVDSSTVPLAAAGGGEKPWGKPGKPWENGENPWGNHRFSGFQAWEK